MVALIFKVLAAAVTLKKDGRRSKKKTANSPINATAGYKRKRRQNGRKKQDAGGVDETDIHPSRRGRVAGAV